MSTLQDVLLLIHMIFLKIAKIYNSGHKCGSNMASKAYKVYLTRIAGVAYNKYKMADASRVAGKSQLTQ